MTEPNKCEQSNLAHAWRPEQKMYGFTLMTEEECANCGLRRGKHYSSREWYSYSDGRPDEEITNMRPV